MNAPNFILGAALVVATDQAWADGRTVLAGVCTGVAVYLFAQSGFWVWAL